MYSWELREQAWLVVHLIFLTNTSYCWLQEKNDKSAVVII